MVAKPTDIQKKVYRDPKLAPAKKPVEDHVIWQCKVCGHNNLSHRRICVTCNADKPPPT